MPPRPYRRAVIKSSIESPATRFEIEEMGMGAFIGLNTSLSVSGGFVGGDGALILPTMEIGSVDEVEWEVDRASRISVSRASGRDTAAAALDCIVRINVIPKSALRRMQLPLVAPLNVASYFSTPPVIVELAAPPAATGWVNLTGQESYSVQDIMTAAQPQLQGVTVQWGLPAINIDQFFSIRGRLVDVIARLAEPWSYCEANRVWITAQDGTIIVGRLDFTTTSANTGGGSAESSLIRAHQFNYSRGAVYGLVTIYGAVDRDSVEVATRDPEETDSFSYESDGEGGSTVNGRVTEQRTFRDEDLAVQTLVRTTYTKRPPTVDPDTGEETPSSGIVRSMVEVSSYLWEDILHDPFTNVMLNRPVLLQENKSITVIDEDGLENPSGQELIQYNYDRYKRQVGSMVTSTQTDPETGDTSSSTKEFKIYSASGGASGHLRGRVTGDGSTDTELLPGSAFGGAGGMPRSGRRFRLRSTGVANSTADGLPDGVLISSAGGANDITIDNPFLDAGAIVTIFNELNATSGRTKIELQVDSLGIIGEKGGGLAFTTPLRGAGSEQLGFPNGKITEQIVEDDREAGLVHSRITAIRYE